MRKATFWSAAVTITLKVQMLLLLHTSYAVQVTTVTPCAKMLPLAGMQPTLAMAQLSVALGVANKAMAVHWPASVGTVISCGQPASSGGVVSVTVTVWLQRAVKPQSLVACQVRVAAKPLPQRPGEFVTVLRAVMTTFAQPSLAVAVSNSHEVPHSTVLSGAQVSVNESAAM